MKTKIERKLRKKTNPELVETIISSKKKKSWLKVSDKISTPKRKQVSINLDQINKKSEDGDVIVIPGKVLGIGKIDKKIKIAALSFSNSAKENLEKTKVDFCTIKEEIKKNPEAKKIRVLN